MNILTVSAHDSAGGAQKVALDLHQGYLHKGHQSWVGVGEKTSNDSSIYPLNQHHYFYRLVRREALRVPGGRREAYLNLLGRANLRVFWNWWQGYDNFELPQTARLIENAPLPPDIVHLHNLHANPTNEFFDLRQLAPLSHKVPTFLTLHDAWLLSGHCAHSFECERWKTGCGSCPDLTIYPKIRRDATAYNWQHKRDIYAKSRLYVATPSQWLMDKVQQSILQAGILQAKVIHNGIDLQIFKPSTKKETIRAKLELPKDAFILLFASNGIRANSFKDYQTLQKALYYLSSSMHQQSICLIGLGEDAPDQRIGQTTIRFIPYVNHPAQVAEYYQAADVYVHAARVDTFPTVILEALACGIPVIGTNIGGIPEQIHNLHSHRPDQATGILTPLGDAQAIADAVILLMNHQELHDQLGKNAAQDARNRFGFERMLDSYLQWYESVLTEWKVH